MRDGERGEMENQEIIRHCDRCGKVVPETAYQQKEWTRFGGRKVQVITRYCQACASVLKGIGQGEYTAMQERASAIPSYEPRGDEDY